jgi:hypothetical protein
MTSRSTNEELQTINDELGIRTAELNQLNGVGGSARTRCRASRRRGTDRPRRARSLARVRGLEPLTRRLAADVADLGAP